MRRSPVAGGGRDADPTWARRLPFKPLPYVAGVVVALGFQTAITKSLIAAGVPGDPSSAARWNSVAAWLTVAVLGLLVVRVEKLPLRTLFPGRPTFRTLGTAVAFAAVLRLLGPVPLLVTAVFLPRRPVAARRDLVMWGVCFAAALLAGTLLFSALVEIFSLGQRPSGNAGRDFITSLSILDRLLIVVTASVTEEVRYRSYLIERLHGLRLSPGAAATLSYVVFVAAHIPFFGLEYVLRIQAVGGAAFPILYYMTRNYWACFALHFLLNIFVLAA